jgi:outer membrane receptor protein involved in Fe transport
MNITGFFGIGDSQASSNLDNSRTYQIVDNVSWIGGSHAFKFGGDIRRLLDDATTNNWPFSQMTFSGDLSANSAADFMLGYPRTTLTPEGVPISAIRQMRYAVYAQDDWKVTRNLTLNLGLRYDLYGQPREINGVTRTLRFDLDPTKPVLWPEPGEVVDVWKNEYNNWRPVSASPIVCRNGW